MAAGWRSRARGRDNLPGGWENSRISARRGRAKRAGNFVSRRGLPSAWWRSGDLANLHSSVAQSQRQVCGSLIAPPIRHSPFAIIHSLITTYPAIGASTNFLLTVCHLFISFSQIKFDPHLNWARVVYLTPCLSPILSTIPWFMTECNGFGPYKSPLLISNIFKKCKLKAKQYILFAITNNE